MHYATVKMVEALGETLGDALGKTTDALQLTQERIELLERKLNRSENALIELRIRTCLVAAMLAPSGEVLGRDAREALEQLAALDTTLYGRVGHLSQRTTPLGEKPPDIAPENLAVDEQRVVGTAERDWREAHA